MSSWGKETVSFLRVSSLLEQDCSCGQGFDKRIGSCKENSKRRSGPTTEVLRRQGKARYTANQEEWVPFMDVFALLIFGVVLFQNMDSLVDLAAIDAFLTYHHSKESPVVAILADLFDTFDRRCEKSSTRIIYCLPALCVWLVSHLFQQDIRHPCPL